ncbi:MAG: glycosyl hydrolase 53 family protein, partial [Firmicutes bacterium]|nr:glycosyl hydrolase 53 family protein [Bacillota bacterium]
MQFGFSDFAFFTDNYDNNTQQAILKHLLENGIRDLRFGVNLIQMPSKYQYGDITYLKENLKYYQSLGFRLHIYFFFSDEVANAAQSFCPALWRELELEEIAIKLETDCKLYLDFFDQEGLEIQSYTLGNEIEWGICGFRPGERISPAGFHSDEDFDWLVERLWSVNARIIKRAAQVIRSRKPKARIVLHSDSIGKNRFTYMLFKTMVDLRVDFDIIGLTYNPWTIWDNDLNDFKKFRKAVSELQELKLPLWIVEYCYPNNIITNGELTAELPPAKYSFNFEGQTAFHTDFIKLCKQIGVEMIYLMVFMLFCVLYFFSPAKAEQKEEVKLEEIVVTATRTETPIESAPASVSVITKEKIELKAPKTIDQALNDVSGVFVRRGKGLMDTLSAITLRGIPDQKRTLILMDGIVLNNPYTGNVRMGGYYPEDLERVEVVKGPFSSLYGGYAMGGVVNFITKMPEKREFTFKTGYGSSWNRGEAMDDLRRTYTSYGDKLWDKLSIFLSYGWQGTNGYPNDLNVQTKKPPAGITGYEI